MFVAMLMVSIALAGLLFVSGTGKLVREKSQMATLDKVGFPRDRAWLLATAEIAGGSGLLAGLSWWPIGAAAAVGLILYFVGATTAHLRVRDWAVAAPVVLIVASAAALTLRIVTS